jgi:hypothetical protein
MDSNTYRLMSGVEARQLLSELGYGINGKDDLWMVTLGLIVTLAGKIDALEKEAATKYPLTSKPSPV